MDGYYSDAMKQLHAGHEKEDPTAEEDFQYEEAMEYLAQNTPRENHSEAFSYNLAMHYMEKKEFFLAKKYLEQGAETGDWTCKEGLGIIWYYGLCGEQDFEKAYKYFENRTWGRSAYLLADMYHYGYCVEKNPDKCREILESLLLKEIPIRYDYHYFYHSIYPEVVLRLARLNIEEGKATLFDLDSLYHARRFLAIRQKNDPYWMNLQTMRSILETIAYMAGEEYRFNDIYDLMVFDFSNAVIKFRYNDTKYQIAIFTEENEIVYEFKDKWFHGIDDFLERARIEDQRFTTVYDSITDIWIDER